MTGDMDRVPCSDDPDDIDREVREGLAYALAEKTTAKDAEVDARLRSADRRLLWTYALVAFALVVYSYVDNRSDSRFQRQIIFNCERQNDQLEQLAKSALTNPARPVEDRAEAAETYRRLISDCPPG